MYSQKELNEILEECIYQCVCSGIVVNDILPDIIINNRATSFWGRCSRVKGTTNTYKIEVTSRLLTATEPMAVKETIMHEVLHGCKNGMTHKGDWKKYAAIVNRDYGYHVKRCTSAKEKGVEEKSRNRLEYKYEVWCTKCNKLIAKRKKASELVINPRRYRCAHCNGELKVKGINGYQVLVAR